MADIRVIDREGRDGTLFMVQVVRPMYVRRTSIWPWSKERRVYKGEITTLAAYNKSNGLPVETGEQTFTDGRDAARLARLLHEQGVPDYDDTFIHE